MKEELTDYTTTYTKEDAQIQIAEWLYEVIDLSVLQIFKRRKLLKKVNELAEEYDIELTI